MQSPQEPSPTSETTQPDTPSDDANFGAELEEVERSLQALKERYTQVQQDQHQQSQLQARSAEMQRQLKHTPQPELKRELKQIQDQLNELEINLESRLFSWGSLREAFWQIVRFGGLGVVIGWLLALSTLTPPKPDPQLPPASPSTPYTP